YALGATLFHLVTGKTPFSGKNSAQIMHARLTAAAPDARSVSPEISEPTANLIGRLMQKDPAKRFQKPEDVEREIASILSGLDAFMMEHAALVSSGADKKASDILSGALSKPEFASYLSAIQAEQRHMLWLAELENSVSAGAARLADNRAFTLVMKDGKKEAV